MAQKEQNKMLKDIFTNKKFLKKDDAMNFKCNTCGKCCFNQNILLTLYDLLNLRREFEVPTMDIVNQFCSLYPGDNSKMPICLLKFNTLPNTEVSICPFLKPEYFKELEEILTTGKSDEATRIKLYQIVKKNKELGKTKQVCSIHKNSPAVCKLYPLGRGFQIDKKTKKMDVNYFQIKKEDLLCDSECYNHKNTIQDYLTSNSLVDPVKDKLAQRYNLLFAEFSEIARSQKNNYFMYNILMLYFVNFDIVSLLQKLNEFPKFERDRMIKKLNVSIGKESVNKNEMSNLLDEIKQYKQIDTKLLAKTLNKNTTDEDINKLYANLIDVCEDILVKFKKKYAKGNSHNNNKKKS